jgi:hypothetical protein
MRWKRERQSHLTRRQCPVVRNRERNRHERARDERRARLRFERGDEDRSAGSKRNVLVLAAVALGFEIGVGRGAEDARRYAQGLALKFE